MNKKILIEKVESTPLSYQKDESDKFLGFLEGIAADSNEKTRNGRRYPIELWKNVENSPEFKEAMETQTCFGEADHPFDERVDTSIKEVAIVLLNFEIKNDGKVYCRFGILDTPNGRLLKSILDSGCQIGVSSRGIGEEVTRNGEVIIDPETYVFYGFDAVVMPAVVSARPSMTEATDVSNPGLKSLSESFNREIESASTKSELESMLRIAENIRSPELDSVKESINIKLESLNNGENISSKLESDLGVLAQENEELKSRVAELESIVSAKNIRINESKKVIHSMRDNSRELSKAIRESKARESDMSRTITKISESANVSKYKTRKESQKIVEDARRTEKRLRNLVSKKSEEVDRLSGSVSKKDMEISRLTESIDAKDAEIRRLSRINESLRNKVSSSEASSKKVIESKDSEIGRMKERLRESSARMSDVLKKYIKTRCMQENLDYSSLLESLPKNYTMDDVDKIIKEFSSRRDRLNKVPVVVAPRKAIITEAFPHPQGYEEERQTMSILENIR